MFIEHSEKNRTRQVIRDIADNAKLPSMALAQLLQWNIQEIFMENRDATGCEPGIQIVDDPSIDLDCDETTHGCCKMTGQCSPSGTDLDDDIIFVKMERPDNLSRNVIVDEEILPERLLRLNANYSFVRD